MTNKLQKLVDNYVANTVEETSATNVMLHSWNRKVSYLAMHTETESVLQPGLCDNGKVIILSYLNKST